MELRSDSANMFAQLHEETDVGLLFTRQMHRGSFSLTYFTQSCALSNIDIKNRGCDRLRRVVVGWVYAKKSTSVKLKEKSWFRLNVHKHVLTDVLSYSGLFSLLNQSESFCLILTTHNPRLKLR